MEEEAIAEYCMSLSGVRQQRPFGESIRCWAVDGRIFAMLAEGSDHISLRCPDEKAAEMLIHHGRAGKLPHFPSGGWISLALKLDDYELKSRLQDSYQMVRAERC